jgi:hypothetical protein
MQAIRIYLNSAGALLLALSAALFLANWASPADSKSPRDPIFLMPVNELFWIIGGISAVFALICFFSESTAFPIYLVLWLALNYLACRIALFWVGCHSLTGYLEDFSSSLAISAGVANAVSDVIFFYLLTGGCIALFADRRLPPEVQFQKMSCPACGGRVRFPLASMGQKVECPHCKVLVTLRKPEESLKMDCFFCKEHIEFPAHALGRKIKCPHCKMEVGLREET